MKRLLITAAILAFVAGLAAPLMAETQTISGEVVDVNCHAKDGDKAMGPDHASCATSCAKRGSALGIATAGGVYTITGDMTNEKNKQLIAWVAKKVKATGEVSEADGKKMIKVTAIEAGS